MGRFRSRSLVSLGVVAAAALVSCAHPSSAPGARADPAPIGDLAAPISAPLAPPPEPVPALPDMAPARPPAPPNPPPTGHRDRLVSWDGALNVPVGSYSDCSGRAAVSRSAAALDPCFMGRSYFIGHNPGVFSPLMKMAVGDRITYYDAAGRAQVFRIVAVRVAARAAFSLPVADAVAAQFQTCEVSDGTFDRLLDAVRD